MSGLWENAELWKINSGNNIKVGSVLQDKIYSSSGEIQLPMLPSDLVPYLHPSVEIHSIDYWGMPSGPAVLEVEAGESDSEKDMVSDL